MRRKLFIALLAAIPLTLIVTLMSNPTRAMSAETKTEETKNQMMEVKVDNFTFGPQTLTVPVNATVTWVNRDDIPHVIVSNDGMFKSKALDTDEKYSFTFTKPGTYPYFCGIHPKMTGRIVVQ
jgi:plastocyanin